MRVRDLVPGDLYHFDSDWGCTMAGFEGHTWLRLVPDFMSDPAPPPLLLYVGKEKVKSISGPPKNYYVFIASGRKCYAPWDVVRRLQNVPESTQNPV